MLYTTGQLEEWMEMSYSALYYWYVGGMEVSNSALYNRYV